MMIDQKLANMLKQRASKGDASILRSPELKSLFEQLKTMPPEGRASFGQEVNALRQELTGVEEVVRLGQHMTLDGEPLGVDEGTDLAMQIIIEASESVDRGPDV